MLDILEVGLEAIVLRLVGDLAVEPGFGGCRRCYFQLLQGMYILEMSQCQMACNLFAFPP